MVWRMVSVSSGGGGGGIGKREGREKTCILQEDVPEKLPVHIALIAWNVMFAVLEYIPARVPGVRVESKFAG